MEQNQRRTENRQKWISIIEIYINWEKETEVMPQNTRTKYGMRRQGSPTTNEQKSEHQNSVTERKVEKYQN